MTNRAGGDSWMTSGVPFFCTSEQIAKAFAEKAGLTVEVPRADDGDGTGESAVVRLMNTLINVLEQEFGPGERPASVGLPVSAVYDAGRKGWMVEVKTDRDKGAYLAKLGRRLQEALGVTSA